MWLLKTSSSWASLLPRLILALTFVPAGWYKISDFQSKALTWSVNFGFPTWVTGVAVFVEFLPIKILFAPFFGVSHCT